MTINSLAIWTVGHSTRTIEEFIDILRHNQIEILVDVRHFPGSRQFPHFNKIALHDALVAAGIRYEHLVELGGRRPVRPDSHNVAWRNASFRGYADYMETQPFRDGVDRLLEIARAGRTAIMCSEAVWFGMPPLQVLKSDLLNGAKLLGWEGQIGELKAGYLADVIAVPGNPLEDIAVTQNVSFVMKGGVIYKR